MIYILAYIILGISTAVSIRYNGANGVPVIAACFVWPLYWFAFLFAHVVGWMPAKCAWCGESVAGHANMGKWRAHYLDVCTRHPLALRVKELYGLIDELDAKNTANRVRAEKAEALASANELALDAANKQLAVDDALLKVEIERVKRLEGR